MRGASHGAGREQNELEVHRGHESGAGQGREVNQIVINLKPHEMAAACRTPTLQPCLKQAQAHARAS